MHRSLLTLSFIFSGLFALANTSHTNPAIQTAINAARATCINSIQLQWAEGQFDRSAITQRLQAKIDAGKALFVHVLVPLCDNEHQGIVPTSASLGNGMSTKSNLYWATSKGMKRYFKEQQDWKLLQTFSNPNEHVLERVIFERQFENGAVVKMIVDAYRGDRMEACLVDYFASLAGTKTPDAEVEGTYGMADLVAFNGHNGLMDVHVSAPKNFDERTKDAVVIACVSGSYFRPELERCGGYPLVLTKSLLYPGAPVMDEVIYRWATLQSNEMIRQGAGDGYYAMKPKSGVNGARNMFVTGW